MKIYTENQVGSYAHSVGTPGMAVEAKKVEAYGNKMEQEAEQYEAKAKRTYSTALKNDATKTMNDLYEQYSDDPVALDNAFKKAYDKVSSEIVDDDVKVDFLADMSLRREAYITKAKENKKRKDYRIDKSTTFDGINADTETAGLAFSAIQGDIFNPDNVAAYGKAMSDAYQKINKMNDDGTFMFSDAQRQEKQKALDRAHLVALKSNFKGLPAPIMRKYIENLSKDQVTVPVGIDKDGYILRNNLQNIVTQETYEKFKDYVSKFAKNKKMLLKSGRVLDEDEAAAIADQQLSNAAVIDSEIDNLKELKKDKPDSDRLDYMGVKKEGKNVERVLRNLELQDNIQNLPEEGLSESDYKRFKKELMEDILDSIKNTEDSFDDATFQESVMSTGLQVMKKDGKMGGKAWSDDMAVAMIRDFYSRAKDTGLDLRATDSGSRASAKKLASEAIENTIQRVSGGYNKEFNSVFLYGDKVSKSSLKDDQGTYNNQNYVIENGKKKYVETQIEVDL